MLRSTAVLAIDSMWDAAIFPIASLPIVSLPMASFPIAPAAIGASSAAWVRVKLPAMVPVAIQPVYVFSLAIGMGLGLPAIFLRSYAAELHIPRIGLFFLVYAIAAIVMRVVTRRWPERFGNRPIILLGLAGMAASMAMFLLVHAEWQLVLPAVGFGCANAILFPSVVAAGSVTFPLRHRGLATLLVLAALDVGQLVGAPMAGAVLQYSETAGLPPYPTMFLTMAGLLALVSAWYAVVSRGSVVVESQ